MILVISNNPYLEEFSRSKMVNRCVNGEDCRRIVKLNDAIFKIRISLSIDQKVEEFV